MAVKKTKKKIIIGNWKMNPTSLDEAKRTFTKIKGYARKLKNSSTVICPPFPYIGVLKKGPGIDVGSQTIHSEERGSFTGEVSALMLKDCGVTYTILGHSERRKMGESDEMIAKKSAAALNAGLTVVICIGEEVRDGQGEYLGFLRNQIKNSLAKVQRKQLPKIIIAYEPIWAIGAQEAMTPRDIHEMSIFIKKILADTFGQEDAFKVPILYGGSVNIRNARDIVFQGEVDGLLIGRESLNPLGFIEILKTIDTL